MATDMQPFLSVVSSTAKHTPSETRERNESRPPSSFADRSITCWQELSLAESPASHRSLRDPNMPRALTHQRIPLKPSTNSQLDKITGSVANTRQEEISDTSDSNQTQEADSDSGQMSRQPRSTKRPPNRPPCRRRNCLLPEWPRRFRWKNRRQVKHPLPPMEQGNPRMRQSERCRRPQLPTSIVPILNLMR